MGAACAVLLDLAGLPPRRDAGFQQSCAHRHQWPRPRWKAGGTHRYEDPEVGRCEVGSVGDVQLGGSPVRQNTNACYAAVIAGGSWRMAYGSGYLDSDGRRRTAT